ncbi:mechanosensitive ion channel family protein [Alistipes sp. ZOR0009]|jgi:small-conductance mechanosensitive channel|uniref:mechanosensitive ion channel family protein n=1 Tax=Alistipes sp. ZOR0009 TaxID=1339253 RepID=UPI0009DCA6F6|nr:mechanosensitive ion channel domain-containing protein [Alistipes sp. ZOR0009]
MTLREILMYNLFEFDKLTIHVYQLVIVAILYLITKLVLFIIKRLLYRRARRHEEALDKGKYHSIYLLIKYFVWIISFSFMLKALGIDVSILLAGSAALFVGLGLGLQQTFNDIVSGIIILFERTIKVNDVVEVDGLVGKVIQINLRTSTIITPDDIEILVPNHRFINENVINWSHNKQATRFDVSVGVAYGSDTEKVKRILTEVAKSHPDILFDKDHDIIVRFTNFGDSSLDFQLKFWSLNSFFIGAIRSDLRFEINRRFNEENVEIPFPQRVVHLKN